jgi:hypothetical protein
MPPSNAMTIIAECNLLRELYKQSFLFNGISLAHSIDMQVIAMLGGFDVIARAGGGW